MTLQFEPGTKRTLRSFAPAPRAAIRAALRRLEVDPFDDALDWKVMDRVEGTRMVRYRVMRHYRIVVILRGDRRIIRRIFHRDEGYGWMERA